MKSCVSAVLLLLSGLCAQMPVDGREQAAYPGSEASAAWHALAASYVRQALKDNTLERAPVLNARVDTAMASVGAAVAAIDPRFAESYWRAILIR